jgi:ribonuclease E
MAPVGRANAALKRRNRQAGAAKSAVLCYNDVKKTFPGWSDENLPMSNPAEKNRWETIWDDLGVTPEASSTQQASTRASSPKPGPAEPVAEIEPPPPQIQVAPLEQEVVEREESHGHGRRKRGQGSAEPAAKEEAVELSEEPAEEQEAGPEGGENETGAPVEEPAPRRRRGRRGSKTREAAATDSTPTDAAPPQAASAEEDEEERPRRRRRSRKKKGDREAAPVAADTEAEPEDAGPEGLEPDVELDDGSEGDEGDDLSNMSVPSWDDLIASLYRPDR